MSVDRWISQAVLQHEPPVDDGVTAAVMSLFVNPKREIRDLVKYRDIHKLGMPATQRLAMFVKDIAHFQDPETRVDILRAVRGQMHGASRMQSSWQEYLPCIAACLRDAYGGVRSAAASVLSEVCVAFSASRTLVDSGRSSSLWIPLCKYFFTVGATAILNTECG
eukprot:40278-Eustigmatos_ZCMA.PRE.1